MADVAAFSHLSRCLSRTARQCGLNVPGFRSPAQPGMTRSIRRRADGSATVSVTVRGRTLRDLAADLVDGVMAANPDAGDDVRAALNETVAQVSS